MFVFQSELIRMETWRGRRTVEWRDDLNNVSIVNNILRIYLFS